MALAVLVTGATGAGVPPAVTPRDRLYRSHQFMLQSTNLSQPASTRGTFSFRHIKAYIAIRHPAQSPLNVKYRPSGRYPENQEQ